MSLANGGWTIDWISLEWNVNILEAESCVYRVSRCCAQAYAFPQPPALIPLANRYARAIEEGRERGGGKGNKRVVKIDCPCLSRLLPVLRREGWVEIEFIAYASGILIEPTTRLVHDYDDEATASPIYTTPVHASYGNKNRNKVRQFSSIPLILFSSFFHDITNETSYTIDDRRYLHHSLRN